MAVTITEKDYIERQHKELFDEFKKWEPVFKDVRDFVYPYLGNFEGDTYNNGTRPDDEMLRTMNIEYANTLAAGMQWGITSPTRPWINYELDDEELMKNPDVLNWLEIRKLRVLDVLARSNFYPSNHQFYLELGVFCTAAMLIEPDDKTVINCRTFTIGEYAIGLDKYGMPNSFARNLKMTAYQLVERFGYENCPVNIQNSFNEKNYSTPYDVKHLICPNKNYNPDKIDNDSKKFSDYYWMCGQKEGEYLRKSGYSMFPVMVERWLVVGNKIYGYGPGIWSLGDAKQIQFMWRDIDTGVEMMVRPPIIAPSDVMRNGGINTYPAGVNYYNPMGGSDNTIKPLFNVNMNIEHGLKVSEMIEECVRKHFQNDAFQLISEINQGSGERTAREVIELTAEKMAQMGPLLDRLQTGYLQQLIERVDSICEEMGVFPEPPEILREYGGMRINVKYVSVLSQAQNQYLITPIVDSFNQVINIANAAQKPEVMDNVDFDSGIRKILEYNGTLAILGMPEEQVDSIRQARAQQQAMMQAAQAGMTITDMAKNASDIDLDKNSALTNVLGGVAGGIPQ